MSPDRDDLKNMPFDLYIRDYTIQQLIASIKRDKAANNGNNTVSNNNNIASNNNNITISTNIANNTAAINNENKSLWILDAGGRNGNLAAFLPEDRVHIIDIRKGKEKDYVRGDLTKAPYKDNSFDVVVSSDVYEHVPEKDRLAFISEMIRVSKNYVILGAPFDSKEVRDVETKACNYFKEIVGEPHPWLKEHRENGLPSQNKLEDILQSLGVNFLALESNNISNWLFLQLFIFYAYKYGIPGEKVNQVYRYYNDNFLDLGDTLAPTYRKIYFFCKEGPLPPIDFVAESKIDSEKYHTLQALVFEALGKFMDTRDTHISNLEKFLSENNKNINAQAKALQEKEAKLVSLAEALRDNENQLSFLNDSIMSKEKHIIELDNQLAESNRALNDIRSSTTWQILAKFQYLVDRLLPVPSKRREAYDLGILGLRALVKEGPEAFLYRARHRFFPEHVNASEVPILETGFSSSGVPLSLKKTVSGNFTFSTEKLNEIKIFTATYLRKNSDLEFQLLDSEEKLQRTVNLKGYKIQDNAYTSFKFEPVRDSKGKTFFFKISSKGEPAAAVWHDKTMRAQDLKLCYDNEPLQGSIGFQAFADLGVKSPYDLWILKNEKMDLKLEQYKNESRNFAYQPKISIVTPVYNPDVRWITAAIESVLHQAYENWELCLADASTKQEVQDCLKKYAEQDPRIKVKFLTQNSGISGNSNEALALATGEYIGLLDHDDELSPDALYEVVKYLQDHRDADMIYSDEDKIDTEGKRKDPFFKPDWSLDMLLSCMYTCHLGIYRRNIIDEIGGFREGYDGSQDYDLVLRFIDKSNRTYHIPKILYHWRTTESSTALNLDSKQYARTAGKKALSDYMARNSIKGRVLDGMWPTSYYLKRDLLGEPLVSIIIPTKDKVDVLKRCIDSILKSTDYPDYEILIINNNSTEKETLEYFEKLGQRDKIKILDYEKAFNFSAINNFAAHKAKGEYLVFLNNDTEVISKGWLRAMLEQAQRKEVGAVGCKLLYSNNTIQHAGVILGITGTPGEKGVAGHSHKYVPMNDKGYFGRVTVIHDLSAVTAACLMMRKAVFEEVGGFEEENLAVAFNDVDLCLKIREKGYLIVYTPYAELYHHESLSRGYEDTPEKQARFSKEFKYIRQKWGETIDSGDPYYSPNLTLEREDFSIRI